MINVNISLEFAKVVSQELQDAMVRIYTHANRENDPGELLAVFSELHRHAYNIANILHNGDQMAIRKMLTLMAEKCTPNAQVE